MRHPKTRRNLGDDVGGAGSAARETRAGPCPTAPWTTSRPTPRRRARGSSLANHLRDSLPSLLRVVWVRGGRGFDCRTWAHLGAPKRFLFLDFSRQSDVLKGTFPLGNLAVKKISCIRKKRLDQLYLFYSRFLLWFARLNSYLDGRWPRGPKGVSELARRPRPRSIATRAQRERRASKLYRSAAIEAGIRGRGRNPKQSKQPQQESTWFADTWAERGGETRRPY